MDQNTEAASVEIAASEDTSGKSKGPKKAKLFPVKLEKNYRPVGDFLIEEDGEKREPSDEEREKVRAGSVIHVPTEEARDIIEKKVALRNDPIG